MCHHFVVLMQEGWGEARTKAAVALLLVHVVACAREEGLIVRGLLCQDVRDIVRLGEAGCPCISQCLRGVVGGCSTVEAQLQEKPPIRKM